MNRIVDYIDWLALKSTETYKRGNVLGYFGILVSIVLLLVTAPIGVFEDE